MEELLQQEFEMAIAFVEQSLVFYIPLVIFTYLSFNLIHNLSNGINEGQKVRVLPKALVSIFCTFILIISYFLLSGIIGKALAFYTLNEVLFMRILFVFHIFIYFLQLVMIWYPKAEIITK